MHCDDIREEREGKKGAAVAAGGLPGRAVCEFQKNERLKPYSRNISGCGGASPPPGLIPKTHKVMARNYYLRFPEFTKSIKVSFVQYEEAKAYSWHYNFYVGEQYHRYGKTLTLSITRLSYLSII